MKRIISILLALLMLFSTAAFASEIPQISPELFFGAKQALVCIAAGEYERLVTLLPFSDVAPSANEWRTFVEGNFWNLPETVQTDYAVAYWTQFGWMLAVPVSEPVSADIETMVFTSTDGNACSGYRYATWGEIQNEYLYAPYVIWDREYIGAAPIIAID